MKLVDMIRRDESVLTTTNLDEYRRKWAKVLGNIPKNSDIWPLLPDGELKRYLRTREVRTMSGVAPFAVMMKPYHCPGECVYCPLEDGMPKSYLSDEPAAQRAKRLNFDPKSQVEMRLLQMEKTGHSRDKLEIIVVGGTFSAYPELYKLEFFLGIYRGVNRTEGEIEGLSRDELLLAIEREQGINEMGGSRIVGISVETRPDWVTEKEVILWRQLGVTKVQLGVQAFDDKIMKRIKRGHSLDEVARATRMCRNAGLKICYHLMPNLPGSSPDKDIEMARMMYEDNRFGPDFVKIYPAMVIEGTELYEMWKRGEYESYPESELYRVLREIKLMTPDWVRIDRLVRDISKQWVESGTKLTNMRQMLQTDLKKAGLRCRCIRCREVRAGEYRNDLTLRQEIRETLGGKELFLSFVDSSDNLYSILRMRLPDHAEKILFDEIVGCAMIREVHTFGQVVDLGDTGTAHSQHKGLGMKLVAEAEKLTREAGYQKMAVISAIGTRGYYAKLGYVRDGLYMTKVLS
jgi:elongator complex protein 3